MLEKEFEVDKQYLHDDFCSPKNHKKQMWFVKHFNDRRKKIQKEYYDFLYEYKVHFLLFANYHDIPYPFSKISTSIPNAQSPHIHGNNLLGH